MKKTLARLTLGILMSVLMAPAAWGMSQNLTLYSTDTVAGFGTLIKISEAPSLEKIEVLVEKPDGGQVVLEETTDRYGKAKLDLEGFYTKRAGQYQVRARVAEGGKAESTNSFRVYPDEASATRSTLELNEQTASANGNNYVELKVNLKDRYGNPISGHTVQLLSSRLTDEIIRISPQSYTDEQGILIYHLYSREPGVSTFLAHDSTANVTLNDRARVAFYAPVQAATFQGGQKVYLAASQSGPVDTLKLEDLPATAQVGQTLNITVGAYDEDGNLATDYTGLVRFSSSDPNANLPNDYQFEAEDQGQHTFSLSLSLRTVGTQTVSVTDINKTAVFGESEIEITSGGGTGQSNTGQNNTGASGNAEGTDPNVSGDGNFDLFTPAPGTYSSSTLTFSGEAAYGLRVEILDNGRSLGTADVKPDGSFSYKAVNLDEGEHTFHLKPVDSQGNDQTGAKNIEITIDTSAPELNQIKITPEGGVPAGKLFTVTAYSEPNLPQASIIFNNGIFEMTEDPLVDGIYTVSLMSPRERGDYSIDTLLVDELGNEIIANGVATVQVIAAPADENATEETEEFEDDEFEDEEIQPLLPPQVTGLTATSESGKVTLSWDAPANHADSKLETSEAMASLQTSDFTDEQLEKFEAVLSEMSEEELNRLFDEFEGDIEAFLAAKEFEDEFADEFINGENEAETTEAVIHHYRIYYGPDPDLMYSRIDTVDNRTTWTVENLQNSTLYYFAVVGVTEEGLESEAWSDIVEASPESSEEEALFAAAEEAARREAALAAQAEALRMAQANSVTPDTGPEVIWLLLFSLGFGIIHFKRERKTDSLERITFHDIR